MSTEIGAPLSGPQITLRRHDDNLEDLLTLVSLAGRERTSWHHLSASDGHVIIEYFDTQRPQPSAVAHPLGPLIARRDVASFLVRSFATLRSSAVRDEIIAASWILSPYHDLSLESEYLAMFASLEALTASLTMRSMSDAVVDETRWKRLRGAIRQQLKAQVGDGKGLTSQERAEMYANLEGLNRRPFSSVWNQLLSSRALQLEDLWPVMSADGLADLRSLRNTLAHGRPVPRALAPSWARALLHLRWTLERLVLSALAFDIDGTDASPEHLFARGLVTAKSVADDRRMFDSG